MNTQISNQPRFEASRQRASQARSEFLSQSIAALYRSVRKAMEKSFGAAAQSTRRATRDA
jgi:hypothetical protein